jgi:hypothetical protein
MLCAGLHEHVRIGPMAWVAIVGRLQRYNYIEIKVESGGEVSSSSTEALPSYGEVEMKRSGESGENKIRNAHSIRWISRLLS